MSVELERFHQGRPRFVVHQPLIDDEGTARQRCAGVA